MPSRQSQQSISILDQEICITLEGAPIDTNTETSSIIQRRPRLVTRGIQLIQVIGLPVDAKFPSKTWRALQSELNRGASPRDLAAQLIW
jgi:hypothetical protein